MKYSVYSIILLLWIPVKLTAQAEKSLGIQDFLVRVEANNSQLSTARREIDIARANLAASKSLFLPNIAASHTALITTNPLMAFGAKLNQGILTQNDFNPALLNRPEATQNFATVFSVQQPLINMDGVFKRKAARSQLQVAALQSERTRQYIGLEAKRSYMELQLAYKAKEVLKRSEKLARVLQKQTKDYYDQGMLQKSDLLLVGLRVIEIQKKLQLAESHIANASNYLSFLMQETAEVVYVPSDSLTLAKGLQAVSKTLSLDRPDVKSMEFVVAASKQDLQSKKMEFLPTLNAFGSFEMYDDKLFKGGASGYIVGAQLRWNLFAGNQRMAKIQQSKARYEQAAGRYDEYKRKSALELSKVKRSLQDAQRSVNLSKLALEQAKEVLRIQIDRYQQGMEKTSDVLDAENELAQKRLAYYQAVYQVNHLVNQIDFLTQ